MSAALFDPDCIMREVRAKAYPSPPAKTANLLKNTPNISGLAKLAGPTQIDAQHAEPAQLNILASWSEPLYEFLSRPRLDDMSIRALGGHMSRCRRIRKRMGCERDEPRLDLRGAICPRRAIRQHVASGSCVVRRRLNRNGRDR
jgi:hypothetical protein